MRIALFGATGGTGIEVLKQALNQGIKVNAFARNASKIIIKDEKLKVFSGSIDDLKFVEECLKDCDAAISCLGVSGKNKTIDICSRGTSKILKAMSITRVKRLIIESAYGAGDTKNRGFYAKLLNLALKSRLDDKAKMEKIIEESKVDWVICRPVILTNGSLTKNYRAASELKLALLPKISRADTAHFMLNQIYGNDHLSKKIIISY